MAYTKLTDFAAKDTMLTGNPLKIIKGVDIDAEFEAIETMLSNVTGTGAVVQQVSPTLTTPTIGVATATSINGAKIGLNGSNNWYLDSQGFPALTTGAYNVSVGAGLQYLTDAEGNIALGISALGSIISGSYNVGIGDNAGALCTGGGNVFIGQSTGSSATSGNNKIVIGSQAEPSAATVSDEITLGNSSIATLRCQVTSITSLSDARDKTDVAPLPSGLGTVMSLKPVRFTWNMRDGGKVGVKDAGFIAQDLQEVDDEYLRLVYSENPEKLEASYGRLIPVLVNAIQELKAEVDELKAKV